MKKVIRRIGSSIGRAIGRYLSEPVANYRPLTTCPSDWLAPILKPGDVLLVEGNTRVSAAIKYLTQSTWSHACLYIGAALAPDATAEDAPVLIEVDMVGGVWAVPLSKYAAFHTRVCRPALITVDDTQRVVDYALSRLGHTYDLKNMIDLARYLLPLPPLPSRWRRRMLALGSGDPSKAICSTLIAQAFQSVGYPILPAMRRRHSDPGAEDHNREILTIRHYSLYTPRDFDISPYFEVVKPTVQHGFSYRGIERERATTEPVEPSREGVVTAAARAPAAAAPAAAAAAAAVNAGTNVPAPRESELELISRLDAESTA
ncbi:MAG TPA: YiiX/YebB-like N1pC/P60 family cysteine hydrolase [Burkholderiales bacterium]|nr:YiiX/YebB-like N1pC/P60 family cysteine hydrolase [Burkholderiales bacterium]